MPVTDFWNNLNRRQIIVIGAVSAVVLYFVLVLFGVLPGLRMSFGPVKPVTLTVWGVFDDEMTLKRIFDSYSGSRQNRLIVHYRRLDFETYERELVDALAAGRGPDIFMIHNSWLPKHFDKILPFEETDLPMADFRNLFPRVVEQDFTSGGFIFALPLYLDTLAMIYNKDFFDQKKIAQPPRNWNEFLAVIPKLREIDAETKKIYRSAAAIGGSRKSVNRATDLLALLMLQTGTQMATNDFTRATFSEAPGLKALNFYVQFANAANPYYTWSDDIHYSIDNFIENDTAVIFNYAHQLPVIKAKNPFLAVGVAPMPQATGGATVNYANYWGLAVSKKTSRYREARELVLGVTANEEPASQYARSLRKPPALRSLINKGVNDPEFGVFNRQALTARSWPQIDNVAVERIFSDMIESVIRGRLTPEAAIDQAEDRVTAMMRQRR